MFFFICVIICLIKTKKYVRFIKTLSDHIQTMNSMINRVKLQEWVKDSEWFIFILVDYFKRSF